MAGSSQLEDWLWAEINWLGFGDQIGGLVPRILLFLFATELRGTLQVVICFQIITLFSRGSCFPLTGLQVNILHRDWKLSANERVFNVYFPLINFHNGGGTCSKRPFAVEIYSQSGLLHISEMADYRVEKVEDICQFGDKISVKVIDIDDRGRIRLSRKAALEEMED